jgi:hypothetical protein
MEEGFSTKAISICLFFSISETRPHAPRTFNPGVIQRDRFDLADDILKCYRHGFVTAGSQHDSIGFLLNQGGTR